MANYQAYENGEGGTLDRVEALCKHLTEAGAFTTTTPVTLAEVEGFLDDAYYMVRGSLARNGYSVTQSGSAVLGLLQQIQAYDTACAVETCMPVTDNGEPNDRYKGMAARRDRLISDYIRTDALEALGAVTVSVRSTGLDATGRSIAGKSAVYDNADVVPARFPRGFGQRGNRSPRSGALTGGADGNL